MDQKLITLFLQSIPESIALSFCAAVFLKVQLDKKKIISIGVIDAVVVFFLRMLPMTFGFHTILVIILFTVLLTLFYEEKILDCFMSILKAFILLSIFEVAAINSLIYLTNKGTEEIINSILLKTIAVNFQTVLLFITGFVILYRRRKKKEN